MSRSKSAVDGPIKYENNQQENAVSRTVKKHPKFQIALFFYEFGEITSYSDSTIVGAHMPRIP